VGVACTQEYAGFLLMIPVVFSSWSMDITDSELWDHSSSYSQLTFMAAQQRSTGGIHSLKERERAKINRHKYTVQLHHYTQVAVKCGDLVADLIWNSRC